MKESLSLHIPTVSEPWWKTVSQAKNNPFDVRFCIIYA